jgi:hypothetical protein
MQLTWSLVPAILLLAAVAPPDTTEAPKSPEPDPYVDRVVSFEPGAGGGFGKDRLPKAVLGPPHGGGKLRAGTDVVSLGNDGVIVLEFVDNEVFDGPGPDLIVFENPMLQDPGDNPDLGFFELAKVEVSLDGVNWTVFPFDTGTRKGCAGHHPVLANPDDNDLSPTDSEKAGGDPFDLADLKLESIRFVRITDLGNKLGANGTTGFDLDAVAAVHSRAPSAASR